VGVEKLFPAKFAKIKSRQDALQTTFSVFLDIFYPPISAILKKMEFFNTHRRLHSLLRRANSCGVLRNAGDHLGRIRRATPSAIRRTTSPISTKANCRWLELLPEAKTPFWLCGIAYDSKYPQFGHRNVVTGMTLSLFSTVRPVQKLGWGSPGHQFSRCNPVCVLSGTQPDSMCA
jgi:hypothetical protein